MNQLVYNWTLEGVAPVSAQVAGEEFERIYQRDGKLLPENVVEASRPVDAPLHNCFEWNDAVAAERYRRSQARWMITHITTVCETLKRDPIVVRAYVSTSESYQPIQKVMMSKDLHEEMMQNAMREMKTFKNKYDTLEALNPVFVAIDSVVEAINREPVSDSIEAVRPAV